MKHTFLTLTIEEKFIRWRTDGHYTGSDLYTGNGMVKAAEIMERFIRDYNVRQFEIRDDRKEAIS